MTEGGALRLGWVTALDTGSRWQRQVLRRGRCRESNHRTHLLLCQRREVREYLFNRRTFGQAAQDRADEHAGAAQDGLPAADTLVTDNVFVVSHEPILP